MEDLLKRIAELEAEKLEQVQEWAAAVVELEHQKEMVKVYQRLYMEQSRKALDLQQIIDEKEEYELERGAYLLEAAS